MAIQQVTAGTDVGVTVTFKNAAGVITDPGTVIMGYIPGQYGTPVTSTYGVGGSTITKTGTGVYYWIITPPITGPYGLWTVEVEGEDTVNVVNPGSFLVLPPKIML